MTSADAVVVGGGTVGAWCAYFLRQAGLGRVVLIEKGHLGQGASSRAAGIVRMQGGTPEAVLLGLWSRQFYLRQRDEIGTDSGFTEQGYLLPCFTEADVAAARERMAMQAGLGVPVRWLDPGEVDQVNPNEFVHILSGRMTVTPDGGEPADIGPGDTAVFPRGWTGTWQIHDTIRKLYVLL
jgi:sarcosine oxidase subunit beta